MSPVPLFWMRWLQIVAVLMLLMGLAFIVTPGPTQTLFNFVIYQQPNLPAWANTEAQAYITFMYAVLGGVMAGWMALFIVVLQTSFREGKRAGWIGLAASTVVWYVVDSGGSILTGFWQNAASNTGFALLLLIPLVATFRVFFPGQRAEA